MDARMAKNIVKYYPIVSPHFGKSCREIAEATGLHQKHVEKMLRTYGWPRLKPGPRSGEKNPSWKGGRTIDKDGYVLVLCKHPNANHAGYVREHRLVMEKVLGRYLLPTEVVHHKNGVHDDNRPENLEVFVTNAEHLRTELTGKTPNWSDEGRKRIREAVQRSANQRTRTNGRFVRNGLQ